MFEQRTEPFGSLEQLTFFNDHSGDLISFLPGYGGCITRLVFRGTSIIDGFRDYEMLQHDKRYRSAWLFPWLNRIKDGQYTFEGKSYQLPVNETDKHTALHGFLFSQKLTLEDVGLSENIATARFTFSYDGLFPGYPFPFELELDYALSGTEGFSATYHLSNRGSFNMPYGAGFHPYFCFEDRDVSGWYLQLPEISHHFVTDPQRLLPTGQRLPFDHFAAPRKLGDMELDHCLKPGARSSRISSRLYDAEMRRQIEVWQDCGPGQFDYLQVFIPPTRDVLAIEPVNSGIDAFNNGEGLKVLAPGASAGASLGIRMENTAS
jgi:aldose 1-epimerase